MIAWVPFVCGLAQWKDRGPKMKASLALGSLCSLGFFLALTSCGGSGGSSQTPPPPLSISVSFTTAPPGTLSIGAFTTVGAAASNASNTQVTWSVTCGSVENCGSFGQTNPTIPNVAYTAPNDIPTGKTVSITATSVADPTKSVSAKVTITATIAFVTSLPAALQINRTASIGALIGAQSVSPSAQVQWSVSCGSADCGSFNPAITSNEGTADTGYTAPGSVPVGNTVTIIATSMADPTQSVSTSVIIIPTAPTLANGTYVFQSTNNPIFFGSYVVGAFAAEGGVITGGEQDSNSYSNETIVNGYDTYLPNPLFQKIIGGSYATTPDGNVEIDLQLQTSPGNGIGSETLTGELTPDGHGFLPQLYGSGGNVTLEQQSSVTAPAGGYAVSLLGGDQGDQYLWIGGIVNIDGPGSISGAGSSFDENNARAFLQAQPIGASTVSNPDQYGRVEFTLNPNATSYLQSMNLVGYMVDSNRIRLIETGGDALGGDVIGLALGQGSNTGALINGSFAGSSYVFTASGVEGVSQEIAGVFNADSAGNISGHLLRVALNQIPLNLLAFSGKWTIDSTGRAVLSVVDESSVSFTLQLYLTGEGNALLLASSDQKLELAGQVFKQPSGTLDASSFTGTFGLNGAQTYEKPQLGEIYSNIVFGPVNSMAANGADTLTGFTDTSYPSNSALSGSLSTSSNGVLTGTITGLYPQAPSTTENFTLFLIDNSRAVAFETDGLQLTVGYLQRLQ